MTHRDDSLPDHCEIRDLAIEDPFYTYCANHPHRRPDRDRIPIGPVTRHGGWAGSGMGEEYPRKVWEPSPDTEDIRQHLLNLLRSIFDHIKHDQYLIGDPLGQIIIWQLGEFREQRAINSLEVLSELELGMLTEAANEALEKIRGDK